MPKPDVLTIEVHHDVAALRDDWRAFQARANAGPHDTWEWNDAWARTAGASTTPLIAIGRTAADGIVFLFPLAIRRRGAYAVLEWLSAEQGNYASGLFLQSAWEKPDLPRGRQLLSQLLKVLPPVDAVHLTSQPNDDSTTSNPLTDLPGMEMASAGYAFPLNADWAAHYEQRFGQRIRADLRRRERRLGEHGDVRLRKVTSDAELVTAIDRMIEDKRRWFANRGINDFLADETLRDFYLMLLRTPARKDVPHLELFELTVGGQPVAANLGYVHNAVFYGLISSTSDGPMLRYGPGNILFLRLIEHLAGRGIERMDCGAGEDENKRRWCTIKRPRMHTIVPTTLKGHLYTTSLRIKLLAKQRIKNSRRLWKLAKRLRQLGSAANAPSASQTRTDVGSAAVRVQS